MTGYVHHASRSTGRASPWSTRAKGNATASDLPRATPEGTPAREQSFLSLCGSCLPSCSPSGTPGAGPPRGLKTALGGAGWRESPRERQITCSSLPVRAVTGKNGRSTGPGRSTLISLARAPNPAERKPRSQLCGGERFPVHVDVPGLFLNMLGQFSLNRRPACSPHQN